jgi:hypothetical protein
MRERRTLRSFALSKDILALVSAGAESHVLRITAQSARWRAGE